VDKVPAQEKIKWLVGDDLDQSVEPEAMEPE
jgi:hypothetical protein